MSRLSTATTATISPRAASRAWPGRCARRWRSIRARRAACRRPKARSEGSVAMKTYTLHVAADAAHGDAGTLARAGRPAVDVVRAGDREEAETKAFARWLGEAPSGPAAPAWRAAAQTAYRAPEPVIGLFPEAERTR